MKRFRAGCGREVDGPDDLKDVAYTDLAYPECPTCPHRLEPDDGASFCRWLDVARAGPFAGLAAFAATLEPALEPATGPGAEEGERA